MTQPSEHFYFLRQNLFKVKNVADLNQKRYYIVFIFTEFFLLELLLISAKMNRINPNPTENSADCHP